jgi:hypothetical protein
MLAQIEQAMIGRHRLTDDPRTVAEGMKPPRKLDQCLKILSPADPIDQEEDVALVVRHHSPILSSSEVLPLVLEGPP